MNDPSFPTEIHSHTVLRGTELAKKCNTSMRFPSVRESHNLKRASNSPVEDGDWGGEGEDFHFDIKVEARVNLVGGD